ncbi:spore coat protein U-like protein [Povalibacter uvarum]|uniref:Spore coat protein U-like protein n=2 Tax=Povalibacter uvarum TaxID=732238 RepID=A0A841HWG4_9GAMM|nr:spore coat protein U-like protein [Povalibacter uvarum]
MNITCSNVVLPSIRVCVSLGSSLYFSGQQRYMIGPSGTAGPVLNYNVYADSNHTQIWGEAQYQVAIDVPLLWPGGGQVQRSYYSKVPPGQSVPPGYYWSKFPYDASGGSYRAIEHNGAAPDCMTVTTAPNYFEFGVTATATAQCVVSATSLSFGTTGNLASALNASSGISITCPQSVPYNVSLNAGQGSGASVAERRLTRVSGTETLAYRLYSDSSRSTLWGDGSAGTSKVNGTGTNGVQTHTVYGTLLAQPVAAAGDYRDMVTVTVTY